MRNQSKTRQSADEACEFQLQPGFTAAQCVAHRMTPGGSRVQQKKKGGGEAPAAAARHVSALSNSCS